MVRVVLLALLTHACRSGGAVVSVGHVERRYGCEQLRDAVVGGLVVDYPKVVTEAVLGREVVLGGVVLHPLGHDRVDLGVIGVCEEYGFDVGFLVAHVDHAVLLLVGAGELVLLDGAREVILEVAAHDQTVLRAAVHGLRIDIIVLFGVLLEPAFRTPLPEVLHGLVVYGLRVLVGNGVEVDLRLDDVEQRALRGLGFGFGRVQHVVGARSHLRSILLRRTDSAERFDSYHDVWIGSLFSTCLPGNACCRSSRSPRSDAQRQDRH